MVGKLIEKLFKIQNVRGQKKQAREFLKGTTGGEKGEKGEMTAVEGKTYLCLVNPYSGAKNGLVLFEEVTKPMFLKGGAKEVLCVVTQRAGHFGELGRRIGKAMLIMKKEKEETLKEEVERERKDWEGEKRRGEEVITWEMVKRLDGVLIFGGDGSLFEFMNGVAWEATGGSFDLKREEVKYVFEKLVVGVVPCGTGNGIAASYGARSVAEASQKIVLGRKKEEKGGELTNVSGYDVCQVTYQDEITKETKRLIDVHYVSWGFVVQHDDLVERVFRSWGEIKMVLAPVICIAQQKTYDGTISFLPALPHTSTKSQFYWDPSTLPDSTKEGEKEEGWKVLEGPFIAVSIGTLPWAAHDMCVSTNLSFDDGELVLLVVRGGISRFQIAKNFMAMSEVGGAQRSPYIELYSVKAVKMRGEEVGPFGASGENILNAKSVDVSVCPSLCRFLKD